ncbi:SMAD/FHA domain-containing protein [Mycena amicta]|nr:SMAD/FHA domain-containing protein [Mycena amicta]
MASPLPMILFSPVYPALYLYPLSAYPSRDAAQNLNHDDTLQKAFFIPKQLLLNVPGQRVPLGRLPPARKPSLEVEEQLYKPGAYFDSPVVSRRHAEVWEQDGKIYIRDTGSANGTFVNGRRLSPEGQGSFSCELRNRDVLELGTDIPGYCDTIAHHRVVCRVVCVFTKVDVAMVAMAMNVPVNLEGEDKI